MTKLTRLRSLLEHIHSFENCSQILSETYTLFEEPKGWFFRRRHQIIVSLIDHPDMFYGVSETNPSPVLDAIALAAIHGIAAIELGDEAELQASARDLSSIHLDG